MIFRLNYLRVSLGIQLDDLSKASDLSKFRVKGLEHIKTKLTITMWNHPQKKQVWLVMHCLNQQFQQWHRLGLVHS